MRSLYLNASRVADAIGVSRFVSREQLFTECQRYGCEGSRPPSEHAEYILSDAQATRRVVGALVPSAPELLTELDSIESNVAALKSQEADEVTGSEATTIAKVGGVESPQKLPAQVSLHQCERRSADVVHRAMQVAIREAVSLEESCQRKEIDACERAVATRITSVPELSETDKASMIRCIRSSVSTSRGVAYEGSVLDHLERTGRKITSRNDRMRYITIDTAPHGKLRVGGRLDGLDEASRQVIEVKCRRYKLMGIRDYEKVQLELYLRMTDLPRALLIETFEGRRVEHEYLRDDALWNRIQAGLADFHGEFLGRTGEGRESFSPGGA